MFDRFGDQREAVCYVMLCEGSRSIQFPNAEIQHVYGGSRETDESWQRDEILNSIPPYTSET